MSGPDVQSPEMENKNHRYVNNRIPWWVGLIWALFWIFCISYLLYYQFPAIKREFLSPP